jgi:PAS domain S-box-containing protein
VLAGWTDGTEKTLAGIIAFLILLAVISHIFFSQLRRRERAEAAQRESERLANATIDALTIKLCVLDEHGTLIATNRPWREAHPTDAKITARWNVGANYLAVCDAATGDPHAKAFAVGIRAVMTGERSEFVLEYPCHAPGEPTERHWFIGRVTRFASDGPVRVVVTHSDVTERRNNTMALIREKERAETYLAISEAIIVELDREGVITRINPRGCQVLGYPEDKLIGRNWFDLTCPAAVRDTDRKIHRRIIRGGIVPSEYSERQLVTRGGELRTIFWRSDLITGPEDEISGTISSGQDVTERRHIEDELRESERRLAKAQAIAHLGNWEEDLLTGEVWWSDEVYRIFERIPKDFGTGGIDYLRFVHPDDHQSILEQERRLAQDGTPVNLDHRIILPDGSQRIVNLQAELQRDINGRAVRATGTVHDITQRKMAELELREAVLQAAIATRTKTEFLSNMSHELNTPLNAVIGFSEMVAEQACGPLDNPKYVEFARIVHRSGRHLQQIVADILDLTKIDTGQNDLDEEALDLVQLIQERIHLLQPGLEGADLTLTARLPERLELVADRHMVKQMLRNLMSNAIKFTPEGGTVTVSLERAPDGRLAIAIGDTGIGMAAADIPRAFDRFTQIDGSLTRRHDGTGLGLSLTKLMIEQHEGSIEIVSQPDRGTTVRLWFPAERVHEPRLALADRPGPADPADPADPTDPLDAIPDSAPTRDSARRGQHGVNGYKLNGIGGGGGTSPFLTIAAQQSEVGDHHVTATAADADLSQTGHRP